MDMGMSVSPQIWQQFIDLVFQDDIVKRKQNFDVIMDDTFIHSTKEEHIVITDNLHHLLMKFISVSGPTSTLPMIRTKQQM